MFCNSSSSRLFGANLADRDPQQTIHTLNIPQFLPRSNDKYTHEAQDEIASSDSRNSSNLITLKQIVNKVVVGNETESYMKVALSQEMDSSRCFPTKVAAIEAEQENEPTESAQTIIVSRNNMIFNNQDC